MTTANTYQFKGTSASGNKLKSYVIATSLIQAKKQLVDRHIHYQSITRSVGLIPRQCLPLPTKYLHQLTLQLHQMLACGLSLIDALNYCLSCNCGPLLSSYLYYLQRDIQLGHSLHAACKKNIIATPPEVITMIQVGESAGHLERSLVNIQQLLARRTAIKTALTQALSYPLFLLVAMVLVLSIFFTIIIPKFAALFSLFGEELPLVTQLLIQLSTTLSQCLPWALIFSIALSLITYRLWLKSVKWRYQLERLLINTPWIGEFILNSQLALIFLAMEMMIDSGINITNSLSLASSSTYLTHLRTLFSHTEQRINQGHALSKALPNHAAITPAMRQVIAIGEKSGQMDQAIHQLYCQLINDNEKAITRIKMYLGNFILLLLGGMIGIIIIAMYLPIFQLGNVIS